jgi:DNA-binding PadR family transcriptional regulator
MYRDRSLLPKEGIRLAALGLLASDGPARYADLAQRVRQFTTTFWGPTLDVMSSSIELLRFEGLIAIGPDQGEPGTAEVAITDAGRTHLRDLLRAQVRSPSSDFSKLVVALKLRYLHLLDAADRVEQLELLIEASETERARLAALLAREATAPFAFQAWLENEIARIDADIRCIERLRDGD